MNSEDKMSKELTRQERLDVEIKKSLDARTKEFKEKINKLTYEKIKQALVPSKEPLKGYPHNESMLEEAYAMNESVDLDEGKMKEFHDYAKEGKSAQWIAKKMGLDMKTVKELMKDMDESKLDEFGGRGMSAADKANLRRRIADKRKK